MFVTNNNFKNYQASYPAKNSDSFKLQKNSTQELACDTVTLSSKNKNKLGFSSQVLYKAKIIQHLGNGVSKLIPVNITQFMRTAPEDIEAMRAVQKSWHLTDWGYEIAKGFSSKDTQNNFLALEVDNDKEKLETKILSLAETLPDAQHIDEGYNDMEIQYIQKAPEDKLGKYSVDTEGIGEVLMYGISRFAKSLGFTDLTLFSTNNRFYKGLNMSKALDIDSDWYTFRNEALDNFMRKVEAKYQIG